MSYETIKKIGQQKLVYKFIKGWIDSYGTILAVFDVSGKKFGFINFKDQQDWYYWLGIGSRRISPEMPAGRGDYLTAQVASPEDVAGIEIALKNAQNSDLQKLNNKGGASWAPKTERELSMLAKLVDDCGEINSYLSSLGILYSGADKTIFGEDVSGKDVLGANIQSSNNANRVKDMGKSTDSSGGTPAASGNTKNVEDFITALSAAYKERFGRDLKVGSTYRDSYNQALAMRYPLKYGDYDRLYGHLGEKAERIKNLISAGDEASAREAAKIIETTPLAKGSHMAGKAIDIPFSPNSLSTGDYNTFASLVSEVSKSTGLSARMNSEKASHFHIDVR